MFDIVFDHDVERILRI